MIGYCVTLVGERAVHRTRPQAHGLTIEEKNLEIARVEFRCNGIPICPRISLKSQAFLKRIYFIGDLDFRIFGIFRQRHFYVPPPSATLPRAA
uniref:Uncharacterized protein n=1 Tax=Candidatus Kentrum sp. TC TaxID=2126339 RepID=A0A450Y7Q7_9GAMM|nr:MAG: hypothetical protein BECKTC1821E_GA0114239_10017 [Candidatus Kentron sp. TC]